MGLELKVEQKQRVYQKQIEQARILQMNAQEIAVYIQEVALENPLIEVEELAEAPLEELVREDMRKSDETGVTASEDTDWSYAGGHQLLEDWWTLQEESLVDIIHQQLLTMPIGEKEKKIVEKLAGSLDRISGDFGEKTGRVHTMFGAGTSECAGDTEIIGAGRNRGRRFEGMSDSAVEATERLPACDYSGKKLSGRSVKT